VTDSAAAEYVIPRRSSPFRHVNTFNCNPQPGVPRKPVFCRKSPRAAVGVYVSAKYRTTCGRCTTLCAQEQLRRHEGSVVMVKPQFPTVDSQSGVRPPFNGPHLALPVANWP